MLCPLALREPGWILDSIPVPCNSNGGTDWAVVRSESDITGLTRYCVIEPTNMNNNNSLGWQRVYVSQQWRADVEVEDDMDPLPDNTDTAQRRQQLRLVGMKLMGKKCSLTHRHTSPVYTSCSAVPEKDNDKVLHMALYAIPSSNPLRRLFLTIAVEGTSTPTATISATEEKSSNTTANSPADYAVFTSLIEKEKKTGMNEYGEKFHEMLEKPANETKPNDHPVKQKSESETTQDTTPPPSTYALFTAMIEKEKKTGFNADGENFMKMLEKKQGDKEEEPKSENTPTETPAPNDYAVFSSLIEKEKKTGQNEYGDNFQQMLEKEKEEMPAASNSESSPMRQSSDEETVLLPDAVTEVFEAIAAQVSSSTTINAPAAAATVIPLNENSATPLLPDTSLPRLAIDVPKALATLVFPFTGGTDNVCFHPHSSPNNLSGEYVAHSFTLAQKDSIRTYDIVLVPTSMEAGDSAAAAIKAADVARGTSGNSDSDSSPPVSESVQQEAASDVFEVVQTLHTTARGLLQGQHDLKVSADVDTLMEAVISLAEVASFYPTTAVVTSSVTSSEIKTEKVFLFPRVLSASYKLAVVVKTKAGLETVGLPFFMCPLLGHRPTIETSSLIPAMLPQSGSHQCVVNGDSNNHNNKCSPSGLVLWLPMPTLESHEMRHKCAALALERLARTGEVTQRRGQCTNVMTILERIRSILLLSCTHSIGFSAVPLPSAVRGLQLLRPPCTQVSRSSLDVLLPYQYTMLLEMEMSTPGAVGTIPLPPRRVLMEYARVRDVRSPSEYIQYLTHTLAGVPEEGQRCPVPVNNCSFEVSEMNAKKGYLWLKGTVKNSTASGAVRHGHFWVRLPTVPEVTSAPSLGSRTYHNVSVDGINTAICSTGVGVLEVLSWML